MTATLPRRFGETFEPITQRSPGQGDIGSVLHGFGGGPLLGHRDGEPENAWDLARQYSYWTFIALRPICNLFSESQPQLSVTTARAGRSVMRQSDRDWIRAKYSSRWLQTDEEELDPLPASHPLAELLERVNREDCWQEFAIETCLVWHLTGRFYWWVVPNGLGRPFELYVIPTHWVTPEYNKTGDLAYYSVRTEAGGVWEMPPEEIIEGKFKNPWSKLGAFSPGQAAPSWHRATLFMEKARELAYQRGVNPDVMLHFSEKMGNPTTEVLNRIEAKFLQRIGGVVNTGKPLLLPPGVEAEKWSNTPREMDFVASSDQNRDDILALWGANRAVCGLQQDIMRANFEGAMVAFCRMTINPLLSLFAGILTEKLAPRFDPRIRVWYRDCAPNDAVQELEETKLDMQSGALTPNERRLARGRDPINEPSYESAYLPVGLSPLSEAAKEALPEPAELPDDEPPPDDDDPEASDDDDADDDV